MLVESPRGHEAIPEPQIGIARNTGRGRSKALKEGRLQGWSIVCYNREKADIECLSMTGALRQRATNPWFSIFSFFAALLSLLLGLFNPT